MWHQKKMIMYIIRDHQHCVSRLWTWTLLKTITDYFQAWAVGCQQNLDVQENLPNIMKGQEATVMTKGWPTNNIAPKPLRTPKPVESTPQVATHTFVLTLSNLQENQRSRRVIHPNCMAWHIHVQVLPTSNMIGLKMWWRWYRWWRIKRWRNLEIFQIPTALTWRWSMTPRNIADKFNKAYFINEKMIIENTGLCWMSSAYLNRSWWCLWD